MEPGLLTAVTGGRGLERQLLYLKLRGGRGDEHMVPGPLTSDENRVSLVDRVNPNSLSSSGTQRSGTLSEAVSGAGSFPRGTRDVSLSPIMGFLLSTLCTYLTQNGLPALGLLHLLAVVGSAS